MNPAQTPSPPYHLVVFTSRLSHDDPQGYADTARRMLELAAAQPGFLGVDTARGADGLGITVSYWRDESSIAAWHRQVEHQAAQDAGRARWYASFTVHVARVDRAYRFPPAGTSTT
ncbi:antibiotic biosynthesis monooxygenase [Solwaraspora sp. WMMD791]|uniref:antibiotic biosynthesis monooxygenase family protein n=1 Tax=Solwaraspora sp. WMMD791 TaxID=3016086 RepID=UPI00249C922F|nr:antibiotic biosynthesis monooxygenase [Solwaraspora sp. WMMD791]WFE28795.1 antibiotic biosynthesis monooxygenase [Solwaraspora sp. WMMD791]